ncbi:MAG: ankyrin repeat domain-containing protein [Gammaproteobacteria bacterium]
MTAVENTTPHRFNPVRLLAFCCILLIALSLLTACSGERYTALMNAARNGDSEAVSRMLDLGANINEKTTKGKTALMLAAAGGYTDTVKLLVERGADVKTRDNYDTTALIAAATSGHPDAAVILLKHGADPTFKDTSGGSALSNATFFGHTETVIAMLDNMPELPPDVGNELLMLAAGLGHQQIATALLKKGVSPNATGIKQRSALMAAVAFDKVELVKLLLERGADINARDEDGATALQVAEDKGSKQEIIELLRSQQDTRR